MASALPMGDSDTGAAALSRRGFLIATMGTGVALGVARPGLAAIDLAAGATREAEIDPSDLFEPTLWYAIDRSGLVTVNVIRAEMGQRYCARPHRRR
jgi:isoquinoline 1-oxidoreductase subunit beta